MMKRVEPVSLFLSYAREDGALCRELTKHLTPLQREGLITTWYDRQIIAGSERQQEIDKQLEDASIILLLVSPDFLASDYYYGVEMKRAMERHNAKEARVIPIRLRPVSEEGAPFVGLEALPADGSFVKSRRDRDAIWVQVIDGIRHVIEDLSLSDTRNDPDVQSDHNSANVSSSVEVQDQISASQAIDNTKKENFIFDKLIYNKKVFRTCLLITVIPPLILALLGLNQYAVFLSIIGLIIVIVSLGAFLLSFEIQPVQRRSGGSKRHPNLQWLLAIVLSLVSLLSSSILLPVVLFRPSWCSPVLCLQSSVTRSQPNRDTNLEMHFLALDASAFVIPDDPINYQGADLPKKIGAQRIDNTTISSTYQIILGVQNLLNPQQISSRILIERVVLVIDRLQSIPHPLNVWRDASPVSYPTLNNYLVIYQGQPAKTSINAIYTDVPYGHVQLQSGEPERLGVQIDSQMAIQMEFHLQLSYRFSTDNPSHLHTLTLPQEFNVAFSNGTNWHEYQLSNGIFVTS